VLVEHSVLQVITTKVLVEQNVVDISEVSVLVRHVVSHVVIASV